ncbi:hypothetical protein CA236_01305 [Sphingomonas sp. ABOLG]|uniref:hypothetical protein n=1 Tax=Sphingomonas sp. ABOLG TaxID=1985880 RepID=UPI000F7ED703|nr:hypothetical protein [Sphingomonas sp. ABOLG]RSV20561.1 hypothetical protein CA236_01305 [Sphingomonas sp. ABOLG]
MSDIVDYAAEITDEHIALGIALARVPIAAGQPGECEDCGEYMPRIVNGQCGFCRDGRTPPPGWEPPVARPLTQEEPSMANGRSVMLPGSATAAIGLLERHARDNDISLGLAAAQLIERGAPAEPAPREVVTLDLFAIGADVLLAHLGERIDQSGELDALKRENAALGAELEAAKAKLAQVSAALSA